MKDYIAGRVFIFDLPISSRIDPASLVTFALFSLLPMQAIFSRSESSRDRASSETGFFLSISLDISVSLGCSVTE
jgi:hypothetical protein